MTAAINNSPDVSSNETDSRTPMHHIWEYDRLRLECFRQRKSNICWGKSPDIAYLAFDEVSYFCSVYIKSVPFDSEKLHRVLLQVNKIGASPPKLIYAPELHDSLCHVLNSNEIPRVISCLKYSIDDLIHESHPINGDTTCQLIPVNSWDQLMQYTQVYLTGFGALRRDIKEVALNIELLNKRKEIELYLVEHRGQVVGVCSNHYDRSTALLSACTISKDCRNNGFHKAVIAERLRRANHLGYENAIVWAYDDSISKQNLQKIGFTESHRYAETVSKPLAQLTSC